METKTDSKNRERMIGEAIRKIALGRSIDRIAMSAPGTGGIGTARMIHGYVARIHDNPADEEFTEYGGTVDVGEFAEETAGSEPVIHKGVLLSGVKDNAGGFLIVPSLFSDVTVISDAATRCMYIVNYSHAEVIQLTTHKEVSIGVSETEALDPEDNDSPDYDELEKTGNEAVTRYTAVGIETAVKNRDGKEATKLITPECISQKTDKSEITQSADKIEQKVNSTALTVEDKRITIGETTANEPLVLGNQLAQLMLEFLTECSKIMTPTMMGTMPAVNAPAFASLTSKIQKFLSQTAFTE
jgi:hypothetical protein